MIFTPSLGVLKEKLPTLFTPALPEEKQRAINVSRIIVTFCFIEN